jgi:hypothetical protein
MYAAQQLKGLAWPSGHHTQPYCQQITMCHGLSSAPPSVATTYQWAQCATSLQSSWIYTRGTTLYMSTPRSSTTWCSTGVTMLIPMKRRPSSFTRAHYLAAGSPNPLPEPVIQWASECRHWPRGHHEGLWSGQREEKEEGHARTLQRQFQWCSSKVLHDLHTTSGTSALTSATVLGHPLIVSAVAAAAAIQLYPSSTVAATGGSQATTIVHTCRLPVLQLRKNRPLRQKLPPAQARQHTTRSSNRSELA